MINYPKGSLQNQAGFNKKASKTVIYGSRGMSLEEQINASNEFYLQRQKAVIHKKPTPIQIVKVDYPKRSAAKITEAYFRQASTTDYNGVYQGYYIDFEAKETKNKTSFPLNNLPLHQRQHMENCYLQGGLVFLLIYFSYHGEVYLLPYPNLRDYLKTKDRKSITYKYIKKHGIPCQKGAFPMIDYLQALDVYLQQGSQA